MSSFPCKRTLDPQPSVTFALIGVLVAACAEPTATPRSLPAQDPSFILTASEAFGAIQIAANQNHACAITRVQRAYCWGGNSDGQIGNGATGTNVTSPARVAEAPPFRAISAGGRHSCALTLAGRAYCWGSNTAGQLGNGMTAPSAVPVPVLSEERFLSIGAGFIHTCALSLSGNVFCWGTNFAGALGAMPSAVCSDPFPNTPCSLTPLAVVAAPTFRQLSVGLAHNCGLQANGVAWCWGFNSFGQTGDGTTTDHMAPIQVVTNARFEHISSGGAHSCGSTFAGQAYCWGVNVVGQLGNGTQATVRTPVAVATSRRFLRVQASGANYLFSHTCAIEHGGDMYCWGGNVAGELGTLTPLPACPNTGFTGTCATTPTRVAGAQRYGGVAPAQQFTCAVTIQLRAQCWGFNGNGELGNPAFPGGSLVPIFVAPPGTT